MPKNDRNVTLRAQLDRPLAPAGRASVRHLLVEVTAPALPPRKETEPAPLNLALVIDNSGSMSGTPLEAAKAAARGVVEHLTARDVLSVVTFETDVHTHCDRLVMDEAGKLRAIGAISRIEAMSTTNLSGGWFRGAELVAAFMADGAATRNHVVLLSDGHANVGILDPEILSRHADELRRRGLLTSTVGIGDGYSPVQLRALAEHGGGRMHDAERPEEIIEIVLAELAQMSATVAEDVRVDVTLPVGVEAEVLGDYPTLRENGRMVSALGSMIAGATRSLLLRVRLNAADVGLASDQVREFTASVRWREPGTQEDLTAAQVTASLTLTADTISARDRRDPLVSAAVGPLWQSWVMLRVGPLNREGRLDEARALLDRELESFREYARELPEGARLIAEMEDVRRNMDHTWDERGLKEVELAHYKWSRGEADMRSESRANWTEFVGRRPRSRS